MGWVVQNPHNVPTTLHDVHGMGASSTTLGITLKVWFRHSISCFHVIIWFICFTTQSVRTAADNNRKTYSRNTASQPRISVLHPIIFAPKWVPMRKGKAGKRLVSASLLHMIDQQTSRELSTTAVGRLKLEKHYYKRMQTGSLLPPKDLLVFRR